MGLFQREKHGFCLRRDFGIRVSWENILHQNRCGAEVRNGTPDCPGKVLFFASASGQKDFML
jgi:hypothetical protein